MTLLNSLRKNSAKHHEIAKKEVKPMRWLTAVLAGIVALFTFSIIAGAVPSDPIFASTLNRLSDSRLDPNNYPAATQEAEAGNITELYIEGVTQTKGWAGFFGNITGNITLEDSSGNKLYDWALAEPQGEIYAANGTVSDWSTVHCFNYTNNGTSYTYSYDGGTKTTTDTNPLNLSMVEASFGFLANDVDGLDETFNESGKLNGGANHTGFYVGTIQITAGSCPATDTYESSSPNGDNFQEVLLTVNNSHTLIFATIIENDAGQNDTDVTGFDGNPHDFQMLVLENGHDGAAQDTTTTYYFYVELE